MKGYVQLNKPRKAWIALLLSILTPGLGHIYAGKARRGLFLLIFIQSVMLAAAIIIVLALPNVLGLITSLSLVIGVLVFCIVDAVRLSRQGKTLYALKKYNRWYFYVLIWLLSGFIYQPISASAIKSNIIQAYKIPSGAMAPTIELGDFILVKKKAFFNPYVNRGDIIIFPCPKDPSVDFIKRVVGLGGETIEIRDKQVFINGQLIAESYAIHTDARTIPGTAMPRDNFGPVEIPHGFFFVMGDNRDNSNDSRFWGFVGQKSVSGRAFLTYWSWDKDESKVRWDRIGSRIE